MNRVLGEDESPVQGKRITRVTKMMKRIKDAQIL